MRYNIVKEEHNRLYSIVSRTENLASAEPPYSAHDDQNAMYAKTFVLISLCF